MSDLNNKDRELEDEKDSKVDAIASIAIILILVTAFVFWVANQ